MQGPVLCSLLGTVNNRAGLLTDPTGNRRFAIVNVKDIDWAYSKDIDMSQVWAQAVELYKEGTSWNLTAGETEMRDAMNEEYLVDDPVEAAILAYFQVTGDEDDMVTSRNVREVLKDQAKVRMGTDRSLSMAVANAMTRLGVGPSKQLRTEGKRTRYYFGVRRKI